MRTPKTFFASYTSFRRNRSVCALFIALALIVPLRTPSTASATSAPAESTIVLETAGAPLLQGTIQVVKNELGSELNAQLITAANHIKTDLGCP